MSAFRNFLVAVLAWSAATASAEHLTTGELEAARSFFNLDETDPNVLEISGWSELRPSGVVEILAYAAVLYPKKLGDRLCIVENRWGQGFVVLDRIEWARELIQVDYDVWEEAGRNCAVDDRTQIPQRVHLRQMIDGASLLRIIDGSDELRNRALELLPPSERVEHAGAKLVSVEVTDFGYHAQFRSNIYGGVSVFYSEGPDGFEIRSIGRYQY